MKLKPQLSKQLISLANKYEVSSFCDEDPSQFLNWYKKGKADIEAASFIAAMLAFGNRKQFIPKFNLYCKPQITLVDQFLPGLDLVRTKMIFLVVLISTTDFIPTTTCRLSLMSLQTFLLHQKLWVIFLKKSGRRPATNWKTRQQSFILQR